jgi:hypothetical protein
VEEAPEGRRILSVVVVLKACSHRAKITRSGVSDIQKIWAGARKILGWRR